jgi:hypothetical protein
MSNGAAQLDGQIARLRELAKLVPSAAPAVAVAMSDVIVANIARGVGPDGAPWERTEEGKQPLRGAAKALEVRAVGTVVVATLTGPEARHHLGAVRGGVRREILPTGGTIPGPMVDRIERAVTDRFRAIMSPTVRR